MLVKLLQEEEGEGKRGMATGEPVGLSEAKLLRETEGGLRKLGLQQAAEVVADHAGEAARRKASHPAFLHGLLAAELEQRERGFFQRHLRLARFPAPKTLADFDFGYQPSIDEGQIRELAGLSFLDRKENVVFIGPPGVGKTHLAVAIGMESLSRGRTVLFVTAQELVASLRLAHRTNLLAGKLRSYTRPDLLIVDELGFLPMDDVDVANLFRLVSERYERGVMIVTSNVGYSQWGQLFGDQILASALLDRLLHHSITVNINGFSYRLKDRLADLTEG